MQTPPLLLISHAIRLITRKTARSDSIEDEDEGESRKAEFVDVESVCLCGFCWFFWERSRICLLIVDTFLLLI